MKIIADTNVFLAVALEEESKSRIISSTSGHELFAPEILFYEIGNALSAMIKRRQIKADQIQAIYSITQNIPVGLMKVDVPKALTIAVEHNLYAYDAYFLFCAKSLNCPLITLDGRMELVAKEMKIEILE